MVRPSTVALQPELRSAMILMRCEGTSIEVSSTLLRAKLSERHLHSRLNAQTVTVSRLPSPSSNKPMQIFSGLTVACLPLAITLCLH